MLRRRELKVDNSNSRPPLQGGYEIVEKDIGLGYLVIHVHKDRGIERARWQSWVVRFT